MKEPKLLTENAWFEETTDSVVIMIDRISIAFLIEEFIDFCNEMDEIRWTQDRYIDAMVEETNMTKTHLKKILNRKVNAYFTAGEAVELGIADIIF